MAISETGSGEHGYALLICATPPGRHRVIDAAGAMHQLAAVPPAMLLGTAAASVVQLSDPMEPNTVLAYLRTAAAAQGPLVVYLAGQVVFDRKQRLPHLALARTTPATVRYTGLPWRWLAGELRDRPPGSTTVLADLVAADASTWGRLLAEPQLLTGRLALYGTLAPPPPRRTTAVPRYSRALAEALRAAGSRPPIGSLHQEAAARAGLGTGGVLLFTGSPDSAGAPHPGRVEAPAAGPFPAATMAANSAAKPAANPELRPAVLSALSARRWAAPVQAPAEQAAVAPPSAASPRPVQDRPVQDPAERAGTDPHAAIREAVRAGGHTEAAAIAAAWEQAAMRASGPTSPEAIHWVEVRADLAMMAGDIARACALWMTAAAARIARGQGPSEDEVIASVDRAHHCWVRITEPATAQDLATDLVELRRKVPGRRPGAVQQLYQRLAALQVEPPQRPNT
jgi:hypothetical protein